MELIYQDEALLVCVKPAGAVSTDEPGGVPELARQALGTEEVYTVHRLDQVVSGLMVLARTREAAAELSRQIRESEFQKAYLAVVHGCPKEEKGIFTDLLARDKQRRMTLVVQEMAKGVQEARLSYRVVRTTGEISRVAVTLHTGRTHQIRVQFASREMPLVGERKYSTREDECGLALWSHRLAFRHPVTGEKMEFRLEPPEVYPWTAV